MPTSTLKGGPCGNHYHIEKFVISRNQLLVEGNNLLVDSNNFLVRVNNLLVEACLI